MAERTEKPTQHKRRQARRDGRLGRTPDIGAWLGMLAASVFVPMTIRSSTGRVRGLMERIPDVIADPQPHRALVLLREAAIAAAIAAAPICLGLLIIGVAASAAQGGVHPSGKLLLPKMSRLNPWPGMKKVFGPHALWELAKALVKTAVLGAVLYSSVHQLVPVLMASGALPLNDIVAAVGTAVLALIRSAAIAGLVMAGADVLVVQRRNTKQLRMTKQEVKEEHRRTEGDPLVRGQIRSRQLAISRNRMMADLPKADVVVVNPTHVAVALRYDPARGAPRVIAKGAGAIASRIRAVATEHRIPMVQDIPLARALHSGCHLGAEIPPDLYAAVARVLAFIMGLKARGSAAGLHRPFGANAANL
jgi:flagellar biosynthesis protein FlhB